MNMLFKNKVDNSQKMWKISRTRHLAWWKRFWSMSEISLDDPVIEQILSVKVYAGKFVTGSGLSAGNILGISTFDRPAWNGNYKINYNHQSPLPEPDGFRAL